MTSKLFVYGTLKKGFYNHHWLPKDSKFLGAGYVTGFEMRSNGGFPYTFPEMDGTIFGELYEVSDLKSCDTLEGYPHHYTRSIVMVHQVPNITEAWMYHVTDEMRDRNLYQLIDDGVWR